MSKFSWKLAANGHSDSSRSAILSEVKDHHCVFTAPTRRFFRREIREAMAHPKLKPPAPSYDGTGGSEVETQGFQPLRSSLA